MKNKIHEQQVSEYAQPFAKYIAMVVRNAMEDFHHQHLSDEQMAELNPIIRNAIYTAVYAFEIRSEQSKAFVNFNLACIPKYWEDPVLLNAFKE